MDSIKDLLADREFKEPPEISRIKDFVKRKYDSDVKVNLTGEHIIISAENSALAASLRANLPELVSAAGTAKKIIFRIG